MTNEKSEKRPEKYFKYIGAALLAFTSSNRYEQDCGF